MISRLLVTLALLSGLTVPTLAQTAPSPQCPPPTPEESAQAAREATLVVVSIDRDRQLWFERQPIQTAQLAPLIACFYQQYPKGHTMIMADPQVPYGDVITVLEIARSLGAERVSLATVGNSAPIPLEFPTSSPLFPSPIPVQPGGDR